MRAISKSGWRLYQDADGTNIFSIQGDGERNYIVYLEHGHERNERVRIALSIPREYMDAAIEAQAPKT